MIVTDSVQTAWASPLVFAPNKDGTITFTADYRNINIVTFCEAVPLPRMDDFKGSLEDKQIFSTFYANSGYAWMKMNDVKEKKTASAFYHGIYQSSCMSVVLKNAPPHPRLSRTSYCSLSNGSLFTST